MKDRTVCESYVCAGATCQKGVTDVTLKKCKNCQKYNPRKQSKRSESISSKRRKDRDRHDNWKKYE